MPSDACVVSICVSPRRISALCQTIPTIPVATGRATYRQVRPAMCRPAHLTGLRGHQARPSRRGAMWVDGNMNEDQLPLLPTWERRFPGRQQWELDRLDACATGLSHHLRVNGLWEVEFGWLLPDGTAVQLKATYPDTFPFTRPLVQLIGGLEHRPSRHVAPIDGTICLLGRASNQWHAGLTLAALLQEKLEDALRGTGTEDPQGEPADYWWNGLGQSGSYCLIDSAWLLGEAISGELILRVVVGKAAGDLPPIHAVVEEVRASDGTVLAQWNSVLPPALAASPHTIRVPWARLAAAVLPSNSVGAQLGALRTAHLPGGGNPQNLGNGLSVRPFAFAHPIELAQGIHGLGWTIGGDWGHPKTFRPKALRTPGVRRTNLTLLPVMRAGLTDLGIRVPAVGLLRDKRVAIFGLGAIGAPVAVELARNGCRTLHLVEGDVVEPGNTVRWPLGASAWGQYKVAALGGFLSAEYPGTSVVPYQQMLGSSNARPDDDVMKAILAEVDLVIDATAAWGVTQMLDERCREHRIPLLQMFATPTLEGGAVVRFAGDGGCLVCLEHAWHHRDIARPPGALKDEVLEQPPGCAERTFAGASYDLGEVSLQAVRLAIETLSQDGPPVSLIHTLRLVDASGRRAPPIWRVDALTKHPNCSCRSGAAL